MQAVVKKVVYSSRYRLGPGQVAREVFYIVLTLKGYTFVKLHKEHPGCFTAKDIRMCTASIFFCKKINS